MNPTLKNIFAVIAGVLAGSIVNMALLQINGTLITLPEGANVSTPEGLAATMSLFQPIHFLAPFLAHAVGTFAGAFVTASLAVTRKQRLAFVIGGWFLLGGISMVFMVPAPRWFTMLDLVLAYLPMSYLASRLVKQV